MKLLLILSVFLFSPGVLAMGSINLHLVDSDPETGFALYRSGKPRIGDIVEFCRMGLDEVVVLTGDAEKVEESFADVCPHIRVVYNRNHKLHLPLKTDFLVGVDTYVNDAKTTGKKILIRGNKGWLRVGRAIAYYQMRHMGYSLEEAQADMKEKGEWMWLYPSLKKQVNALYDWIHSRGCSEAQRHCVRP